MEWMITAGEPGKTYLMQGNEAIARGALEAGARFVASYPGSPSSEIVGMLGRCANQIGLYAEWSTNETSALEACMGASFGRMRALCVMKQNGLLTVGDALHTAALSGCRGGLVLVVADDPGAHSSTNEFDSRHQARSASLPMLEPATYQEALDMVRYAFDLSETLQQPVMVRTVTRINHGRGNVTLGSLPTRQSSPAPIGEWDMLLAINAMHELMLQKLDTAAAKFEETPFNTYQGPDSPDLMIITSGTGWFYAREAVERLQLKDKVGILKLGTTWPLPENLVLYHLQHSNRVLVLEEVDPFLEQNLSILLAHHPGLTVHLFGRSGPDPVIPRTGELTPDLVLAAISRLTGKSYSPAQPGQVSEGEAVTIPPRELTFCAGCPHRASFFLLKQALRLDGREGLVFGDIGCYTLGGTRAGYFGFKALGCMGGGINMATGMGQLTRFGFNQPIIALAGDSTFYHSCIPGLINARYHNSDLLFVVLDNSATAMTGFQPHPGIETTCMGERAHQMDLTRIGEAIGIPVTIADPYQVEETCELVGRLIEEPGAKMLVLRHPCATLTARQRGKRRVWVDQEICRGDECGCGRFCSRVWGCPGNIWDYQAGKARIDEVVCAGCGVCASLCPAGAIKVEEVAAP